MVLPSLKEEIQKKMKETELELQSMGQGIPQDSDEQRKFISQVVNLSKNTLYVELHIYKIYPIQIFKMPKLLSAYIQYVK